MTIFPEVFISTAFKGVVGHAILENKVCLNPIDLRQFSDKKYKQIDDRPFGGSDGMIFRPEPLSRAIRSIKRHSKSLAIYLTPQGHLFTQDLAKDLSQKDQLILVCGRYGGIDERVICDDIDLELSIGDYILSGGELPAMIIIDVIIRLQQGILGNQVSSEQDSFGKTGFLESPQFTRPRIFQGRPVPEVLLTGHHQKIADWERKIAILRTFFRRPHLLKTHKVSTEEKKAIKEFYWSLSEKERETCGLPKDAKKLFL